MSTVGSTAAKPKPTALNIKPAFLERGDAAAFLALSETTMGRLVNEDPDFPQPRSLSGRRVGWLVRELEAWAESRPIADNLPPPNTGHNNRPNRLLQYAGSNPSSSSQ